jgi:nickel-dependent lactate racemase
MVEDSHRMCFKVKVKYSQTDDEIQAKFGAETVRRVAIRNHPFKDPSPLVDLGTTRNGGRILS